MAGNKNKRQVDVTAPVKSMMVLVSRTIQASTSEPKCSTIVTQRKTISGSFLYVYYEALVWTLRLSSSSFESSFATLKGTGFNVSL